MEQQRFVEDFHGYSVGNGVCALRLGTLRAYCAPFLPARALFEWLGAPRPGHPSLTMSHPEGWLKRLRSLNMPRPKRKLRALSDDDSDGPSPSGAQVEAGFDSSSEGPGVASKCSSEAADGSDGTSPAKSENFEDEKPMNFEEKPMPPMAGLPEPQAKKAKQHRARRAAAASSIASQCQLGEASGEAGSLGYPKPRSKFVSLLWEFASPPRPLLSVDVD